MIDLADALSALLGLRSETSTSVGLPRGNTAGSFGRVDYGAVHFRTGMIAKTEELGGTAKRHVRALRNAMHSLGGSLRVLVESDSVRGLQMLQQQAPDIEWI